MCTNFRTEVFKLCKKMQNDVTSKEIGEMIYHMSSSDNSNETGENSYKSRHDLAYLALHSNTEFYGFLFYDDNIEKINIPHLFKLEHLLPMEKSLIELGHQTLVRFIDLCLSDIAVKARELADCMNPYGLNKEIKISETSLSLLSDEDLMPAVQAFKNGKAYKALINSHFERLFSKIHIDVMHRLIGDLEKEIYDSLEGDVSVDFRNFSMKLDFGMNNGADVAFAFTILMFALKESLKLSCRLLYRAICGVDLFVLNNENIINIEKNVSNVMGEFYKVFTQELHFDFTCSEMGSILLINCDLHKNHHIHEFGMITSATFSLAGEFGESAKYSFVTLNEELIYIHNMVNGILRAGLPIVNIN